MYAMSNEYDTTTMNGVHTLFLCEISTEWSRPNHGWATISGYLGASGKSSRSGLVDCQVSRNSPLWAADALGCLIELCSHIEVVNCTIIEDDQGVDLEVSVVEIYVNRV